MTDVGLKLCLSSVITYDHRASTVVSHLNHIAKVRHLLPCSLRFPENVRTFPRISSLHILPREKEALPQNG